MILFPIDVDGVAGSEAKSDPPRPIDRNGKSLRLAVQPMKMQSGQIHILRLLRLIECIEKA